MSVGELRNVPHRSARGRRAPGAAGAGGAHVARPASGAAECAPRLPGAREAGTGPAPRPPPRRVSGRSMTTRRRIIAVIGNGRATPEAAAVAEELGRLIVESGWRVLSGGLGGVMEAASR